MFFINNEILSKIAYNILLDNINANLSLILSINLGAITYLTLYILLNRRN